MIYSRRHPENLKRIAERVKKSSSKLTWHDYDSMLKYEEDLFKLLLSIPKRK